MDTHDPSNPLYTDLTVTNLGNRQWQWMLCNEPFGWWPGYVLLAPHSPSRSTIVNLVPLWEHNTRSTNQY